MHLATALYVNVKSRVATLRANGERGLTTTEVAVLTFILVGIAVVIGGLLLTTGSEAITNIDSTPVVTSETGVQTSDGPAGG